MAIEKKGPGSFDFSSDEWLAVIDASSFDPEEWEKAAVILKARLENDELEVEFEQIREYLSCCAQSVIGTYPLPGLSDIAVEFYESHGIEKATKSKVK